MSLITRAYGRLNDQLRPITLTRHFTAHAEGSVLVSFGQTKVLCTASIEEKVPPHQRGSGQGWVTAEYGMLPRATHTRSDREAAKGKQSGRTQEIQRLIGRSLRSIIDLKKIGERTVQIDCDVMVADGGTRTTSISGAYVALEIAMRKLMAEKLISENPLSEQLAAISVGVTKDGKVIADLNYEEDSSCETDMNVVMTKSGKFVEVQGTAEGHPFSHDHLMALLECAKTCLETVFEKQIEALK